MKKINIKKGAIALAFITTIALTTPACASINDITYATDASGYIDSIEGTVSYKFLESCNFVKVINNVTDATYYTIVLREGITAKPYDIFTKQYLNSMYGETIFEKEYYDNVVAWLNALNMTKSEYTEEDLRELLNIFIEKQEKDKQLVKE